MRELRIVSAPLHPELMREITRQEKLRPLEGDGPVEAALEICDFEILDGPAEEERSWGSRATYLFNGGGEHNNIEFRVRILNQGADDFSGMCSVTVYSRSVAAFYGTPYLILTPGQRSEYFNLVLNQSEWIERGDLSVGRYEFRAKIQPPPASPEDPRPEPVYSSNEVILRLSSRLRPTPVGRAIPIETITLMSQSSLTGSVSNQGDTGRHLQVGNWSWTGVARGFISFDLSGIRRELLRRGRYWNWNELEIRSATLEIEEFAILSDVPGTFGGWFAEVWDFFFGSVDWEGGRPPPIYCGEVPPYLHEEVGYMLLDYLISYDEFLSDIYDALMVTNLRTFQSACDVHSFRHMEAYVRYQLERGERRIQFRLRFADEELEGEPEWTWIYSVFFRNPRLIVTVVPK